MNITIEGTPYAPNFEDVENLIKSAFNIEGKLYKIGRRDNGVYYRGPGIYDITFLITESTPTRLAGEEIPVVLDVR